ncbi:MAG: AAA family ATPase [Chloroflexota bacterium]
MKIKIWGARGSIPTPISTRELHEKMIMILEGATDIDLHDPIAIRGYLAGLHPLVAGTAGGDTACVEIQADNQVIILDAGSGIRALGQELMSGPCGRGQGEIHLFFSHTHWDHIQGIPFFLPAYVPGNQIFVYGVHDVETPLNDQMVPATFPISLDNLQATFTFTRLTERQSMELGNISITNMKLAHPGDAYAYRFECQGNVFVYATDVECKQIDPVSLQPLVSFVAGADAVIFDSQFTLRESLVKADWGHSSAIVGAEIARRAKVKRLILFHHDPTTSDAELIEILQQTRTYQTQFEAEPTTEIMVGRESLTLNLMPPQPFTIRPASNDETAIILITEDFDQAAAAQVIETYTKKALDGQLPKLIVDLSEVKQLYIASLRSLIDLRSAWKSRPIALAAVSSQAYEIIELTNCLDLFAIYPSVKTAQDALDAQEALRLPGQLVHNRYLIESKLRDSDIGTVFKAVDTRLDREVALHVLSSTLNQPTVKRLLQQAQKLARLQAPNIVTLFDADQENGLGYLVMEYFDALSLRDLIENNLTPPLLLVADGIVKALEYGHSKGAFHGNLRPNNILVGEDIKLSDFGLQLLQENASLSDAALMIERSRYQAPEQIAGQPIDARTDMFALGVILYQLSTGQSPYHNHDFEQSPLPPRELNPQLSRSFEHLLLKLLSVDPDDRYQSASQIRQVLANLNPDSVVIHPEYTETETVVKPDIADPSMATAPELIPQRRGRLIGRDTEIQQILKLWSMAEHGRGQVLLIGGEAGIGKTRLTEEVDREIEHGVALWGRCSEFEGNPPYQPFVEVGRHYLQQISPDLFVKQVGGSPGSINLAASLAPLITEIYDLLPNLKPLPKLTPEQESARLQNSLVQFIEQAANYQPWMIVLDDLHWADPSSLQLLHYLARNVADLPLLIVGTYRDVELDSDHPLREMMAALSRSPVYHQMSLQRLSREQVGEMLVEMWQQDVPDEWVEAIYQRAGGNPFYIKEVTKTLVDDAVVTFDDGVWHFSQVIELKLPPKVRDIVVRRINRVGQEGQELLAQASVLGQQFNYGDLLAISSLNETQLLACLDESMGHNLIREVDGGATLAFSNVEIQQVIYEELSQLRRRMLHRHIGQTLEHYYKDDLPPVSGRLAYHFGQANDQENAFTYSLKAGQHAQTLFAYQTALRWYTQAADMLSDDQEYSQVHISLFRGLGDMLQTETRFGEAIDAYTTMSKVAVSVGDRLAQVQALYLLSATLNGQGEYQLALQKAAEAEQAARDAKTQDILARALYEKGWALLNLGETDEALVVGEQVLTFSRTIDATYEIGQSLNLLAAAHSALGNYAKGIEYQEQGLTLYRQIGDRHRVSVMLNNLAETYSLKQDFEPAVSLFEEALEIARETGDRASQILYLSNLSAAYIGLADYEGAEKQLLTVIQMPETIRSVNLADVHRNLAEARLGQNKIQEALVAAELSLALSRDTMTPEILGRAWRTLGRVSAYHNEPVMVDEQLYTPSDCFSASLKTFKTVNLVGESIHTLHTWADYEASHDNPSLAEKLRQDAKAAQVNS